MVKHIYLDHNATTPLKPEVFEVIKVALQHTANASSVHTPGREARRMVENARAQVAALVGAKPAEVVFTGGATEANNTVLKGAGVARILISGVEHSSVRNVVPDAEYIPVSPDGVVDLAALDTMLQQSDVPTLVSIMAVNSETGVIQPVAEAAKITKKHGALLHSDAVQATARIPVDMAGWGVDLMSLSAHKIGGPQGVGAVIIREGVELTPLKHGGRQEGNRRSGTENVAGITAFGKAAELATEQMGSYERLRPLRDDMEKRLAAIAPESLFFGQNAPRVANTTMVVLPGVPSDVQIMTLDLQGVAVSSGSACSSGVAKPTPVLMAMGASEELARCALRISLGWTSTAEDIDGMVAAYEKLYAQVKDKIVRAA